MNLASRVRQAWAVLRGKPRARNAAFPGADLGRLTSSWTTDPGAVNRWLRYELKTLRARSRQLARGDAYGKKFVESCVTNIAGPNPFQLQSKIKFGASGLPNDTANTAIELAWTERCKVGNVEVTGRLSRKEFDRLVVRCIARDGEALIRQYQPERKGESLKLQLIDIDRLDENRNENLRGGGSIKMGVEVDEFSKPVAYHILKQHPGEIGEWSRSYERVTERVPAEEIRHLFVSDWPEQVRGIPWMHAALVRLYHLGAFEEAAVVNARIGASKIATLETPDGEVPDSMATGTQGGNLLTDIEPGSYWQLPGGMKLGSFNPTFPDASVEPFIRSCLRGISSALGMAYHSLANDPAQVNYSTARVALLEERDHWMTLQEWYIEHFCTPDFEAWVRGEILSGNFPASYWQQRSQVRWQPKRWSWVDPEKDANAKKLMLDMRLTSRSRIASELGEDFEEIAHEISHDDQLADSLGIELEPETANGGAMSGPEKEPADAGSASS